MDKHIRGPGNTTTHATQGLTECMYMAIMQTVRAAFAVCAMDGLVEAWSWDRRLKFFFFFEFFFALDASCMFILREDSSLPFQFVINGSENKIASFLLQLNLIDHFYLKLNLTGQSFILTIPRYHLFIHR